MPRKRPAGTPGGALDRKQDRLTRQRFNFLENLLIFCVQPKRRAPAESGVQFGIRSTVLSDGICLLFKVDRQPDPLMPEAGRKPDYLVVHVSKQQGCLCTIVEMKGKDLHKAEHAIEQIKTLWERLRREVNEHVPGPWRKHVRYQGLILTPHGVQAPLRKLEKAREHLTIVVLSHSQTFDLYEYVRRPLEYGERYHHPRGVVSFRPGGDDSAKAEFNAMEAVLARGGLPDRLPVPCRQGDVDGAPPNHKGLWLDFANPGDDNCEEKLGGHELDFVRLLVSSKGLRLVAEARAATFVGRLEQALRARNLPTEGLFDTFAAPA